MRKLLAKALHRTAFRLMNRIYRRLLRLQSRKVVFFSDVRETLGGNLEYIYNYLDGALYEKVTIFKRTRGSQWSFLEKFEAVYHLSTAKYILLDDFSTLISLMQPRKGQKICQVWHGSGAYKKFGFSRTDNRSTHRAKWTQHRNYTNILVSSSAVIDCYIEGFGAQRETIKATGTPRTDLFFNEDQMAENRQSFYQDYPELVGKKIILFAPTYRGRSIPSATYDYDSIDFLKLYRELHDQGYVFIFKWHPAIYNIIGDSLSSQLASFGDFFYDLSSRRDINDLLLVADILITDYSSVIFDYALLGKPIIYYDYDLYSYLTARGLYYDLMDYIYGPIVMNTNDLIKVITNPEVHETERNLFIEKFMGACDGHSTANACDWIFSDHHGRNGNQ